MYGLYIHFPYCIHKCSYCDFYSIENLNSRNRFAESLAKEISLKTATCKKKPVIKTIFFGGGTPSLMKPHHFDKINNAIFDNFDLAANYEWTIECNPGAIDTKNLNHYKQAGVNRISFGVQSFNENELKFLERIHSINDIYNSISIARKAGFDNINIDLMFALPNQTLQSWHNTLEKAIELGTEHISAYSLIYEEGTPLHSSFVQGKVTQTDEDEDYIFYKTAYNKLSKAGFMQYEVSNYAKDNKTCQHNINYWKQGEYYSFGPSAHGYLNNTRYWNYRDNDIYFNKLESSQLPVENTEKLNVNQLMLERIYLELRAEGLNLERFNIDFGIDIFSLLEHNFINRFESKIEIFNKKLIKLNSDGLFTGDFITLYLSALIDDEKKENVKLS